MASVDSSVRNIGVESKIFYPSHGAGKIIKEKVIEFGGEKKKYFEFSFINKKLTISTPVQNLDTLGIRPVRLPDYILGKIKVLKSRPISKPAVRNYNELIEVIRDLDTRGEVDAFIEIIQYCNHEMRTREKEGRLIPVSIVKYVKTSIDHLVSELAVSSGLGYDEALKQFREFTGIKIL
ncbi:hypothetical protein KC622_00385, partial [Candidatus Dojkabacteria bacterium]|nr:hypothetical protein [Candidatus Dojkabacteria bacterium]MCB9790483.1 hypothetical protein [Candidatus Nomurabacteria bacterium]